MMPMWLIMALLLVAGLGYLFSSLQKSQRAQKREQQEQSVSFLQVRQDEIHAEQANGRLTQSEADILLKDLTREAQLGADTGSWQVNPTLMSKVFSTKWVMLVAFIGVVLGSVSLYQSLGYAKEVAFNQSLVSKTNTNQSTIDFLRYRSERYDRAEDWYYLANQLMAVANYPQAMDAFKHALVKLPEASQDRAEVLVKYAQAIFYNNGNRSSDEMEKLVTQVLAIEPKNATALGLKGVVAFDHKNYQQALLAWQDAARNNDNADERQTLLGAIQSARQAGNISYQEVPPLITKQISIKILWDKANLVWQTDDVLLVYAVLPGQKMPIAIRRVYPQDLNHVITLTNLDNLMSSMSLEDVSMVDLVVKRSKISAKDLTKGSVIGIKKAVPANTKAIYTINVTL